MWALIEFHPDEVQTGKISGNERNDLKSEESLKLSGLLLLCLHTYSYAWKVEDGTALIGDFGTLLSILVGDGAQILMKSGRVTMVIMIVKSGLTSYSMFWMQLAVDGMGSVEW